MLFSAGIRTAILAGELRSSAPASVLLMLLRYKFVLGFEMVRQLTLEYSIRTRSEVLSFRTALAGKSFSLHGSETSASTVVTDSIRKIDYEMARYTKLLGTLSSRIDATGLHVAEADLVAVLLRSLPDAVRTFCLHHTGGETYQAFRPPALRWEQQQRAFAEFHPKKNFR